MLQAIGAGAVAKVKQDWGQIWAESTEYTEVVKQVETICKERKNLASAITDDREYAMPLTAQLVALTRRTFTSVWRDPNYLLAKYLPIFCKLMRLILHVITGLFNTFTYWMVSSDLVGMQNHLFSVFMTLTISPPLIQQLQPRFIGMRKLLAAREGPSKLYKWTAFVFAAFIVEIPWSFLFGTIFYFCWYWGVGFPRGTSAAAYVWLMLMGFEVFYISFGQMLASVSPNAMFASLLIPALFPFIVAFCGVVAPPQAIPHFWSSWMYCISPFLHSSDSDRVDAVPLLA
jgi:ATP-binding cassette, subfamily G (WHITE), member 2, SNQ2